MHRSGWLAICILLGGLPMRAGFLDNQVQVDYLFPDSTAVYLAFGSPVITSEGVAFSLFSNERFLVNDTTILMTSTIPEFKHGMFLPAAFNGMRFIDPDGDPAILGVTIESNNLFGFDASRISFDSTTILLNFQNLTTSSGDVVSLRVQFGAANAPEPSSASFVSFALAILAGAVSVRRARIHVCQAGRF